MGEPGHAHHLLQRERRAHVLRPPRRWEPRDGEERRLCGRHRGLREPERRPRQQQSRPHGGWPDEADGHGPLLGDLCGVRRRPGLQRQHGRGAGLDGDELLRPRHRRLRRDDPPVLRGRLLPQRRRPPREHPPPVRRPREGHARGLRGADDGPVLGQQEPVQVAQLVPGLGPPRPGQRPLFQRGEPEAGRRGAQGGSEHGPIRHLQLLGGFTVGGLQGRPGVVRLPRIRRDGLCPCEQPRPLGDIPSEHELQGELLRELPAGILRYWRGLRRDPPGRNCLPPRASGVRGPVDSHHYRRERPRGPTALRPRGPRGPRPRLGASLHGPGGVQRIRHHHDPRAGYQRRLRAGQYDEHDGDDPGGRQPRRDCRWLRPLAGHNHHRLRGGGRGRRPAGAPR